MEQPNIHHEDTKSTKKNKDFLRVLRAFVVLIFFER